MEPDFSGYVTKNDLKCTDGVTIRADAFKHQDKQVVPLVWKHKTDSPGNILGRIELENRSDGVYGRAFFNDTTNGQTAKQLVHHGDMTAMSIFANRLTRNGADVLGGHIQEVSLVTSGANPGARIDKVYLRHGDGMEEYLDDEIIIHNGLTITHASGESSGDQNEGDSVAEKTVKDVYDEFTEEQKTVVHYMIGEAISAVEDDEDDDDIEQGEELTGDDILEHIDKTIKEGFENMGRNVFEQNGEIKHSNEELTHDQLGTIVKDAKRGGSLKDSFLQHAEDYGFNNIDILFPDAKNLSNSPEVFKRQTEWVTEVLSNTKHVPYARIKTIVADITADEARARGYVTGNLKKEEVIQLLKRVTTPTTIYKKQKLDRNDMIDITDIDVVAWLKIEMRAMLNEELARAILIGDGRSISDEDHIPDPAGAPQGEGIRSIANDSDFYAHQITVPTGVDPEDLVDRLVRARSQYKGSGNPVLFTTDQIITDLLLIKDKVNRRIYEDEVSLSRALRVSKIVPVEVMESEPDILAIMVNLRDYAVGTDKGGEISFFDDFDIDYNQYKYLIETRGSGALTKPKSAVVVRRVAGTAVTPVSPSFDGDTNEITIPTTTGVQYTIDGVVVTGDVEIEETTTVTAVSIPGYHIPFGTTRNWTFVYTP